MVLIYRGEQLIGADIIDLKTEQLNSTQLHDHTNRHRPQLQAYRTAAATFLRLPVERISTRLVFIETGQIVNLHAIEGSIDFSPNKKRTPQKSARKKPVRSKPVNDKVTNENPVKVKPVETLEPETKTEATPKPSPHIVAQDQPVSKPHTKPTAPTKSTTPIQKTLWD